MKNGTSSPSDPNPSRWHLARVRRLFQQAQGLPPAQRNAMVRAADADPSTVAEVLSLLRMSDAEATEWIRRSAEGLQSDAEDGDQLGSGAGDKVQSTATGELLEKLSKAPKLDEQRFSLEGEVGKGGMGAVLKIHDHFLNRRLAMKVLLERPAPRDESERKLAHQLLGRFLEEAQVTSQLDHPGVVPVHELGLDANGKVWFTMRLVKGRTASHVFADALADTNDWTLTRALEVVLKVCDTMAYAHEKGVLHRDLKPSNVMVGRFGEVYVMDWGLAKVLGHPDCHDLRIRKDESTGVSRIESARKRDQESDAASSVVSMDGQQLGTPSYMPPEQARSEPLDQRADVYAIGAMMYELLTGIPPYVAPGARKPAYRILDDVLYGPPKRIEAIQKGVPAELVAIVERAMHRERDGRYPSVLELAADVRAFLAQRAVAAYRTGAFVELRLWVKRNRALAASLLAALLILVVGLAGMSELAAKNGQLATDEAKAKEEAIAQRNRANEKAEDAAQAEADAERERDRVTALSEAQKQLLAESSWAAFNQADRLFATSDAAKSGRDPASAREALLHLARAIKFDPTNHLARERFALEVASRFDQWVDRDYRVIPRQGPPVMDIVAATHGHRFFVKTASTVEVWDAESGNRIHQLECRGEMGIDRNGTRMVITHAGVATLWDIDKGRPLAALEDHSGWMRFVFAPDGQRLIGFAASSTRIRVWDLDGQPLPAIELEHPLRSAAFSTDGAAIGIIGTARLNHQWMAVINAANGATINSRLLPSARPGECHWSPDLTRVAIIDAPAMTVYRVTDGRELWSAPCERNAALEWSPDGSRVLAMGKLLVQLDARDGHVLWDRPGDYREDAHYHPSGESVFVLGFGRVQVIDATTGELNWSRFHPSASAFLRKLDCFVAVTENGNLCYFLPTVRHFLHRIPHYQTVDHAAFDASGTRLVTVSGGTTAAVWSLDRGGSLLQIYEHRDGVAQATFSPDGSRLLTVTRLNTAKIWDTATGELRMTLTHELPIQVAAFAHNGARVVTASRDRSVRLWDSTSGRLLLTLVHGGEVTGAQISPDGRYLATACSDGQERIWDADSGAPLVALGHKKKLTGARFSPDSTRIITTCGDGTARIWRVPSNELLMSLAHDGSVETADWNHDGTLVLTGGADQTVRVWEPSSGKLQAVMRHGCRVAHAEFSPDATRVVSVGNDSRVRLWDVASGKQLLSAHLGGPVYRASFDPSGSRLVATASKAAVLIHVAWARQLGVTNPRGYADQAGVLAEALTDQALSADGNLTSSVLETDFQRIGANRSSELAPLLRWIAERGEMAPFLPDGALSRRDRASTLLEDGGMPALAEAIRVDPSHPLIPLAMAGFVTPAEPYGRSDVQRQIDEDVATRRRAFLRDRSTELLPEDAALCVRAAKMLLDQGEKARAAQVAEKALKVDPLNPEALRLRAASR